MLPRRAFVGNERFYETVNIHSFIHSSLIGIVRRVHY